MERSAADRRNRSRRCLVVVLVLVYETNITEGLNIFRFSENATAGAMKLDHLNPQTQEFTLD